MTRTASPPDPRDLPPMLDLMTAAGLLGIGRATAYQLARHGTFPVPVLRIGASYRIPTAPLLELLGIPRNAAAADRAA